MILALGDITNYISDAKSVINSNPSDSVLSDVVFDSSWFDIRFMPPSSKMASVDVYNRFYTTASRKFTSTRLGGNFGINPKPQFTRYADIRHGNRAFSSSQSTGILSADAGLGRFYSERYDDPQQSIMMQFGKEKFNSLPNFVLSAIDYRDSYIANTGRYPTGYSVGKFLGNGIMLAAFPLITIAIWGLKFASKLVLGTATFDYYYMEPTMHVYWSAVSQIVTTMGTELGILIPELMPDGSQADKVGVPVKLNTADLDEYKKMMPDLFTENNYIDVFKIATTTQTLANRMLLQEYELFEKKESSEYDFLGYVFKDGVVKEKASAGSGLINKLNYNLSFKNYLDKLTKGKGLFAEEDKTVNNKNTSEGAAATDGSTTPSTDKTTTGYTKDEKGLYKPFVDNTPYLDKMAEAIDAGIKEGGGYATFNVEYVGTVSESFSNSVGEIGLSEKINSVAAAARNIKFDFAGGNIAGDFVKSVTDGVVNVAAGALDSVTFGVSNVIQTLTGNAFVDLPKKWNSSDMSMPSITYNMPLRALYNTTFSRLKDELIPIAMILAGTLPLSGGENSHTSPFLCEVFCKGVTHVKMGMVTSLTITRGVNNLGMDKNRNMRGYDISFTVTDFSSLMTAPVNASIFDSFNIALEDNKPLNRYIATLASRDLLTSKYIVPKMKLKASRLLMNLDQAFSPHAMGLRLGSALNGLLGGLVADHAMHLTQTK